jgi:hypothetical protein
MKFLGQQHLLGLLIRFFICALSSITAALAVGITVVPMQAPATEDSTFTYNIKLPERPLSSSIPSVFVIVNLIDSGEKDGEGKTFCKLADSSTKQIQLEYSFETWNIPQPVNIDIAQNRYTLKRKSHITTCRVNHSIVSQDALYKYANNTFFNISIVSKGCGLGEYHGDDFMQYVSSENECLCSPQYYKPNNFEDCRNCNLIEGIACNKIGTKSPPTIAKKYWRYEIASNISKIYDIYKCPYSDACIGGNNNTSRCRIGHHNNIPLCSTCENNYVMIHETCTSCHGHINYNEQSNKFQISSIIPVHSLHLMFILLFSSTILIIFFNLYITKRAISKKAERELKAKLIGLNLDIIFNNATDHHLAANVFINILNEHHEKFSTDEIHLLFQIVDKDQNGYIDKMELLLYATNAGWVDVENIETNRKAYKQHVKTNKNRRMNLGTAYMKLKLVFSYLQILAMYGVTYSNTIAWPNLFKIAMSYLEFTTFDLYSIPFAEFIDCHMQATFLQHFVYNVAIFPSLLLFIFVAYEMGIVYRKCKRRIYNDPQDKSNRGSVKFTPDSMVGNAYTLINFTAYILYAGIGTRVFQILKCTKFIIGTGNVAKYLLSADFSVACYDNASYYWYYVSLGIFCFVTYIIGYPAVQMMLLHHNRKYLYYHNESNNKHQTTHYGGDFAERRHRAVKKRLGAAYLDYSQNLYYFDTLDLLRRLLLCGVLSLLNDVYNTNIEIVDTSGVQIMIGIFISFVWALAIAYKRPYVAYWDNVLSLTLSAHLFIILLVGMYLTLWHAKRSHMNVSSNEFEAPYVFFATIFLLASTVLCMVLGIGLFILSLSYVQHLKCFTKLYNHLLTEEEQEQQDQIMDHFEHASEWLEQQKQILGIMTAEDVVDSLSECKKVLMKTLQNEEVQLQENLTKWDEKLKHYQSQHLKLSSEIDELKKVLENPSLSGKLKIVTKKELDEKVDALMKNNKMKLHASRETREYKRKIKMKGNRGKMIQTLKKKRKKVIKIDEIYKGGTTIAPNGRVKTNKSFEPSIMPSFKDACATICCCCCKRTCNKYHKRIVRMVYKRKTIVGPRTHEMKDIVSVRNNDAALFGATQNFIVGVPKLVKKKSSKIRKSNRRKIRRAAQNNTTAN